MTGRNFAAGMSGGVAYVLDDEGTFAQRCNPGMVQLEPVLPETEQESKVPRAVWHLGMADELILRRLIEGHARHTGSAQAKHLLENWQARLGSFVKVLPHEYRRALGELAEKRSRLAA
jgi:glutamate synthase domain-containing protein 3